MRYTFEGKLKPLGYEKIGDLSSAASLTVPVGATVALVRAEGANVRWRADGTAPTASDGMLLATSDGLLTLSGNLDQYRFVQVSAGAVLHVHYYRPEA